MMKHIKRQSFLTHIGVDLVSAIFLYTSWYGEYIPLLVCIHYSICFFRRPSGEHLASSLSIALLRQDIAQGMLPVWKWLLMLNNNYIFPCLFISYLWVLLVEQSDLWYIAIDAWYMMIDRSFLLFITVCSAIASMRDVPETEHYYTRSHHAFWITVYLLLAGIVSFVVAHLLFTQLQGLWIRGIAIATMASYAVFLFAYLLGEEE